MIDYLVTALVVILAALCIWAFDELRGQDDR